MARLPQGLLGQATGKPGVAMAVTKGGLCQQIIKLLPRDGEDTEDKIGGACAEWQKI